MGSVRLHVHKNIAVVQIDYPELWNGVGFENIEEFPSIVKQAEADGEVSAIVVTGVPALFSVGGSSDFLSEIARYSESSRYQWLRRGQEWIRSVAGSKKVTISWVDGLVAGAGTDLALACDIFVATENTRFAGMYNRLGVIPDAGGLYFASERLGPAGCLALYSTRSVVDSNELVRFGVANAVLSQDLDPVAIATKVRRTFEFGATDVAKGLLYANRTETIEEHLRHVAKQQAQLMGRSEFSSRLEEVKKLQALMSAQRPL